MPDKPNILLVHGAWGDASHWRHIIPPLHEKGYRVFAVQNPLTGLMLRWLECPDSQEASSALGRALSLQGSGDPVFPGPGIWPIPPA